MSQENVELAKRLFGEEIGGESRVAESFHPDVEFLPLRAATEGAYRGIDDMERFFADTLEVFEKFEPHYEGRSMCGRGAAASRRTSPRGAYCSSVTARSFAGRTSARRRRPSKPWGWRGR
jgi:hypothetical protein